MGGMLAERWEGSMGGMRYMGGMLAERREGSMECGMSTKCGAQSRNIPPGMPPKMVFSLKIPPGSVARGRDARPFQSLFLRST
jgi:hypothetical protein